MVLQIVETIESSFLSKSNIKTDNFVFRLHYRWTIPLLLFCGVLVTSFNVFHQPIECSSNQKNVKREFINAYCYSIPTFTIDQPFLNGKNIEASEIPQSPGLTNSKKFGGHKIYVSYYQWVSFVLFSQAFLLYFTRYIWCHYEKNIVDYLMLNYEVDKFDTEKILLKTNKTIELLVERPRICSNFRYYLLVFLEVLNLINVMGQFVLMNHFLNMNFIEYGWKVLKFDNWSYEYYFDPMTKMFPKVTKCLYSDFGAGGSPNVIDYLCVLPYNNINEKIYLVIWIWFQILIFASFINLTYRACLCISHRLRCKMILNRTETDLNKTAVSSIIFNASIGEWYILNVLRKNLDDAMFSDIVNGIHEILSQKKNVANHYHG